MMRTYQISEAYSIEGLKIVEKDVPKLLPNQVLLRLTALSLNYRDLLVVKGVDDWKPPVGRIPVSDGVGIVVAAGSNVTTVAANDRVAGIFFPNWISGDLTTEKLINPLGGKVRDGMLQEYVVLNEQEVIRVPAYLTDEEAATLSCAALTAWHGLIEKGGIKKGSTVLIQGTGGVSLFSIQFALMMGAQVLLISGSDEKLKKGKDMGAVHLINYKKFSDWHQEVLSITDGRGVDHIVEVVGGDHINKSIEAIALDGTISIIGVIDGLKGNINTSKIMSKQIKLQGINVGSKEMFARMTEAMELHKIRPVIDTVYTFGQARVALAKLEQSAHFGKICISL